LKISFEIGTAPTGSRIVERRAENFVTKEDGSHFVSGNRELNTNGNGHKEVYF
jgi:hypothetical protein